MDDAELEDIKRRIVAATTAWASAASLAEIRTGFEALFADADQTGFSPFAIGSMHAGFVETPRSSKERIILFCHGGGFQVGSIGSHFGLVRRLADAARARVLAFDYRLAPEHRCPAALEDSVSAYRWLLGQGIPPYRIALAGDSAGGALAVGIAVAARDNGLPMPACMALISPWLDLAMRGESYSSRAELDIFSKPQQLAAMSRAYLGRHRNALDPLASPVEADLSGLAPIIIHAADHDITRDDALLFAERARQYDARAELRVWPGLFHHFQMFGELPASKESLAELGRFIIERIPDATDGPDAGI
jgi:monoterpene epsilon-lactone hydrolase